MIPSRNSTRLRGTCYRTSFHPATNIVDKDAIGIENVVTSPSLQKTDNQNLLALPINAAPLKNDVAPIEEGSLSQFFSRLHQRWIFNFLSGHEEVERLPCSEISENEELHEQSRTTLSLDKNQQEVFQLPDQQSIFKFLNGHVFQYLLFLVDFDFESNSGSDICEDLSSCLSLLNLENSPYGNSCLDKTRQNVQDNESTSTVSHKLQLTDNYATEHLTTDPTVKMNGFTEVIDGNIHSECSFSTSKPFFDSPLHYYQKRSNGVKLSDKDTDLGSETNQSYFIENLSGMLSESNCDAEIFEQTTTTYQENLPDFCQHPTNRNSVESTFAVPDPDELLEYLHGALSSPKFLLSDPSERESDKIQFSLHLGYCSSDEGAESDNLSDSITNLSGGACRIIQEYGIFDTLGYEIGAGIGAMTGAFGEIESPDLPSLPDPSQIEQIRWNWANRDVDFYCFDFGDHEELLELYGLNEQDVQVNDDEFCNSPTWPGKRFIQESELEYLVAISVSVKETDSISEIAGTITAENRTEIYSTSYTSLPRDDCCNIVSQAHEERHESSASRIYHQPSFANVSDTEILPGIHINTTHQYRNTANLSASGTSGNSFKYFQEYPAIESDEELEFTIPDPDELMEFLHGNLSSPKFQTSDPLNAESDNFPFSSHFGNSDEVAKADNLSDSITNGGGVCPRNDNKYGIFDTFDYTIESGISATTGAFGEIEISSIPTLPNTSQIEKIRWNWPSLEVNSSAFDLDDHQDLLELYELSEQDVDANNDEFCDSPTWPGKL